MVFLVCWYYLILPFGAFCKFSITILPNSLVCLFSMNLTWLVYLFCLTYEIKFLCNFSSAFLNLKKLITFDDLPSEIRMSYNMCDLTNFGFPLIELSLTLYLFKQKSVSLRSMNFHLYTPKDNLNYYLCGGNSATHVWCDKLANSL